MSHEDTFDFIVIGAGPAGCAVASQLAAAKEAPTVALVETGPAKASWLSDVPMGIAALVPFRGRHNYGYQTVPQAALSGRRGSCRAGGGSAAAA